MNDNDIPLGPLPKFKIINKYFNLNTNRLYLFNLNIVPYNILPKLNGKNPEIIKAI